MFKTPKNLTLKEPNKEEIRPKSILRNNLNNLSSTNSLSSLISFSNENANKNKKIYKIKTSLVNVDKEQLYENNIQLKKYINKLEKELLVLKFKLSQKEKEIKNKEKIIDKYITNSKDLKDKEKIIESNIISHYKDKYLEIKTQYEEELNKNEKMKENLKETKLKECLIQNDVLKNQMFKMRKIFKKNKKKEQIIKKANSQLNLFKQKFIEQHILLTTFMKSNEKLNTEITTLKREKSQVNTELENSKKKNDKLKHSLDKLKIKNMRYLDHKKSLEEIKFNNLNFEQTIRQLKSELNSIKFAYESKSNNYNELLKQFNDYKKLFDDKNNNDVLKPFNYDEIKDIEKIPLPKNFNEIELYKSLYKESRLKNIIYEKYLIEIKVSPKQIIKDYGFDGVINNDNNINE